MKKVNLFWIGWTIWIVMVVFKMIMVFTDYPDFCWDPMFLMVPFSFIIIGGLSSEKEYPNNEKTMDKN